MPRHLSFAFFCSLALLLGARETLAGPATPELADRPIRQRPRFTHLTRQDGLTHDIVTAIQQDRRGFLWFGTWGGLDRFDGYEMVHFRHQPDDPTSLGSSSIRALIEDRDGLLWVATTRGVSHYDPEHQVFTNFAHHPEDPHSLGEGEVWALLDEPTGGVWALTLGGGLSRFDPATGHWLHYRHQHDDPDSLASSFGRAIDRDTQGMLWIGTPDAGLDRLDPTTGQVSHYRHRADDPSSLSGDDIWSIEQDSLGQLWVGTRTHGLNRLDPASGQVTRYLPDAQAAGALRGGFVFDLLEDQAGVLWVATYDGGLHRYDRAHDRFVNYTNDPTDPTSLGLFQTTSLFEDNQGGLWIGTFGRGVDRLDPGASRFDLLRPDPDDPDSLAGKDVRAVRQDADGALWIGTYDGGLSHYDRRRGHFENYRHRPGDPTSLSDNRIESLLVDHQGMVWVGTWGHGLHRLDPASGVFSHFRHDPADPTSLSDDDIRGIVEDPDGSLWIATGSGGLNHLRLDADRRSGWAERFSHDRDDPQTLDEGTILAMVASRDQHTLWLGIWGAGLDAFDRPSGQVRRWRAEPGDPESLSSSEVWALYEQGDGTLWIGTDAGLDRLDPASGALSHYYERDGLASTAVYDITEDDRGALWLATGAGLSQLDLASGAFRHFDESDGVLHGNALDGCVYRAADGELFFGGKNGLLSFRPSQLTDNPFLPPVVLTDFRIFNQPIGVGGQGSPLERSITATDRLLLPHDASVFTIGFAALSYRAPLKNRYELQLAGLESSTNQVGADRRYATYTNLDPGTYTLRVWASNNDGLWNRQPRSLEIVILPPMWETWWFRTLALLALGAVVWGVFQLRTASIRAHNRQLEDEIAQRRRVESEREQLIAELGEKNELLEAQKGELERFTYTVSHDLKSPLVTIKGFLGLLARDVAAGRTDSLQRDVATIGRAADQMQRLLTDLLELSRVGRVVNPPQPVPLAELAYEAVELVAGRLQQSNIQVVIDEPMPTVYVDRQRLLEVMQNLIDNATKFMGSQPRPRIEIGARRDGAQVLCHVRDNGIGIDPRYHDKVFGLFDRLDPQVEGTGVGLALVKRIIELHGGKIWIGPDEDTQGTTFFFTLPLPPSALAGGQR